MLGRTATSTVALSAVSVKGFMASLMSRSIMIVGTLQGNSLTEKGLCKLIHGIFESFARHKLGGVGGADLNFCAGLRVAACACLALDHLWNKQDVTIPK